MKINNINVRKFQSLITPSQLKGLEPVSSNTYQQIIKYRKEIENIVLNKDKRLLFIIGPCSIHDEKLAIDYCKRLQKVREKYNSKFCIVMRVYFEKPRTTIGWKGLINDPYLNDTYDITSGLKKARRILQNITKYQVPIATEFLDPIVPQYISDLISWCAIGARTTESQTHREMASGLSMAVGFKNSTDGNTQVALEAMISCKNPHYFLGINDQGNINIVSTKGNPISHIVLRGGKSLPNYYAKNIQKVQKDLKEKELIERILIDCSHANSDKKYYQQEIVYKDIIQQIKEGNNNILGMMLESNIYEGRQELKKDLSELKYGISITDACLSWETTEMLLDYAYEKLPTIK